MDKYKLAFISEDGTLEKYGEFCDDSYHAKYLLEYINKTYPNVPLFKKLTIKHNPGTIAFFISRMNKIVFMNTTMKNIKQGEFIFPDVITDKQKETLYSLAEIIKNYNITIEYNLRIEDGLINSDIIKNSPISAIDEYFKLDNTITKKK